MNHVYKIGDIVATTSLSFLHDEGELFEIVGYFSTEYRVKRLCDGKGFILPGCVIEGANDKHGAKDVDTMETMV